MTTSYTASSGFVPPLNAPKSLLQLAEEYEAAAAKTRELATAKLAAEAAEREARKALENAFALVMGEMFKGISYSWEIATLVRKLAEELRRDVPIPG